jgi:hypothetical protein
MFVAHTLMHDWEWFCNSQDDFNNIGIDWDGPVPVITDRQQNDVVVPETTCVLPPSSQEEFTRRIHKKNQLIKREWILWNRYIHWSCNFTTKLASKPRNLVFYDVKLADLPFEGSFSIHIRARATEIDLCGHLLG